MVLEGLPVDVEDKLSELTQFLVKIDSGFDATNVVIEGGRENSFNVCEGSARLFEFLLV